MIVSSRFHERHSHLIESLRRAFSFKRPERTERPSLFPANRKWWESPLLQACDRLKDKMVEVRAAERRV